MSKYASRASLVLFVSLLTAVAGCGDDDGTMPPGDAGTPPGDSSVRDGGENRDAGMPGDLPTCAAPETVMGTVGTVTVTGNTDGGDPGMDLGEACGNPDAAAPAPQYVIAYQVPGSGTMAIEVSTLNAETDDSFDTLIQVRTDCGAIPDPAAFAPTCFDDAGGGLKSEGTVLAEGGSTIFVIVTGYADTPIDGATDAGSFTLNITAREENLPAVVSGEVRIIGERADIVVEGSDADGDPLGVLATFLDGTGAPVDLNDDGAVDEEDDVARAFDNLDEIAGMTSYTGVASIPGLGGRLTELGVAEATIRLIDEAFGIGEAATVATAVYTEVGYGEACGDTALCTTGLECTAGLCSASAATIAACDAATTITVAAPTTTTTTATETGTLEPGDGVITGGCGATAGDEVVYSVTVPAGSFDLVARTDLAGTGELDTVVYIRSDCPNPTAEVACNDDIEAGVFPSRAVVTDVAAGTYAVIVEAFGGADESSPFELEVGLRPVLSAGAACDPTEVENRCAGGTCPGTMVCP